MSDREYIIECISEARAMIEMAGIYPERFPNMKEYVKDLKDSERILKSIERNR